MDQRIDLVANCWTIGGDVVPGTDRQLSPYSLRARIEAAAAAGYAGIGLWYGDLLRADRSDRYRTLRSTLTGNGIRAVELEYLADWFAGGERRRQSDAVRQALLRAGSELGARHIKVTPPFGNQGLELPRLVDAFGELCMNAAEYDLIIALEMIPFSDLATLDAALEVVAGAGAQNGGLLVDIWHVMRSGADYQAVAALPSHYVVAAELNDADLVMQGDMADDSMHCRKYCGDGEFDVPGFIAAMQRAGYRGPYGVEILSDTLRRTPLDEVARRSFETTRAMFSGGG